MPSNKPYEVELRGNILALAKIGRENKDSFDREEIITTCVKVDGTYYPDWQCEDIYYHNEGYADYDIMDCEPLYNDEFQTINARGKKEENKRNIIKKIIMIFDEDVEVKE